MGRGPRVHDHVGEGEDVGRDQGTVPLKGGTVIKTTWMLMLLCAACLWSHDRATAATITLSWEGGPAAHPSVNRTRAEGSVATVVATVTGFEQPVLGVQVWIRV